MEPQLLLWIDSFGRLLITKQKRIKDTSYNLGKKLQRSTIYNKGLCFRTKRKHQQKKTKLMLTHYTYTYEFKIHHNFCFPITLPDYILWFVYPHYESGKTFSSIFLFSAFKYHIPEKKILSVQIGCTRDAYICNMKTTKRTLS